MSGMSVEVVGVVPEGHTAFFVTIRSPRADWPAEMTEHERACMGEHSLWLESHVRAGRCAFAGPLTDLSVGISGWDGLPIEELHSVLASDPADVAGVMTTRVQAWHFSYGWASPGR